MNFSHRKVLEALEKAIHSGNITDIVPEDLEVEAHNTLWQESDPGELTLLKLCPSVPATSIVHEYTRITSFGESRNSGFFGERSLPPETNFESQRVTTSIKLMGEIGPTFLLAALEKTQRALGTTGAQSIERIALRRNVLWKKNRNLYFSDTSTTRLGANSSRFEGLAQIIREGTDGTSGTSPYGSHEIDMMGLPLTPETIRERVTKGITLFGRFTCLIMDPFARQNLESHLDSAQRLDMPIAAKPYMVGQNVGGLQTQGGITYFETDNTLSPIWATGQYTTSLAEGAPTTTPTVSVSIGAPGGGRESRWDALSAGNVYWVVTEVVDELEGLGTRFPAGAAFTAVAAGQEATLTLTSGNPLADSMRVYRGTEDDVSDPGDAWFIYEVAGNGTGAAITSYDNNFNRPNTSWAFGLNIRSKSERALHDGLLDSYHRAVESNANFLGQPDNPRNTVAVAELGPSMGIMALASILAEVDRPLVYSACAPQVRVPRQNITFKNIGLA